MPQIPDFLSFVVYLQCHETDTKTRDFGHLTATFMVQAHLYQEAKLKNHKHWQCDFHTNDSNEQKIPPTDILGKTVWKPVP